MGSSLRVGDIDVGGRVWLAPMTGVSDLPFRKAASKLGAAYVATEMVACAEFSKGRPDVVRRAAVGEGLPLTVIQLVGRDPAAMAQGARMAEAAGADIIDLNFGCPAREVTGALCGSALMREPELAARLISAAVEAVTVPVTVKMRLGWDDASKNAPEFAARLGRWRNDGVREARFLIGAADGFGDAERGRADLLLSFGRATWPHMLARAMLAEQLYRATTILAGHPYHREG